MVCPFHDQLDTCRNSTGVGTANGKSQVRVMAFDPERIKKKVAALGAKGVYVGTSSWKYEGWFDRNRTPTEFVVRQ